MPAFLIALFKFGLAAGKWLATTRAGNVAIAFAVAWVMSGVRHDHAWQAKIAAQTAELHEKHAKEVMREANAAREIAEAGVARAEDDAAVAGDLNRQIAELKAKKESPNVPAATPGVSCIDRDFLERVRRLDATGSGDRASRASTAISDLRKAGSASLSAQCRVLAAFALENRAAAILANRRLVGDGKFYSDVRREFSAKSKKAP